METDIRLLIDVPSGYGNATGLWESKTDIVNTPFTLLSPMFQILEDDSSWIDFRTGDSYILQMPIHVFTVLMQYGTIPLAEVMHTGLKTIGRLKYMLPTALLDRYFLRLQKKV